MKNLTVELKKCKRTGILVVLPLVGLLGALYAFVNFIVRKGDCEKKSVNKILL